MKYDGKYTQLFSGPVWRKRRKVVIPNYGRRAVQSYEVVFNQEADMTLERLRNVPVGKTFDIYDDIVRGTTYTVCRELHLFISLTKRSGLDGYNFLNEVIPFTQLHFVIE